MAIAAAVLLLLLCAGHGSAGDAEGDARDPPTPQNSAEHNNGVVILTDENFGMALGEFPILLVKFYAPWCTMCKKVAPEFARAARTFRKHKLNAYLAEVNIDENEKLRQTYVTEYVPKFLLFQHNKDGTESIPQVWMGPTVNATGIVHHLIDYMKTGVQPIFNGDIEASALTGMEHVTNGMNDIQMYATGAGLVVLASFFAGAAYVYVKRSRDRATVGKKKGKDKGGEKEAKKKR